MSIPKGWEEVRLGDICDVIMGQSPSSSAYNDEEIGLPLIQGNTDVEDRLTAPRRYTSVVTKTCDVGDILMSVRAPVGSVFKSIHHACIGRGVAAIKPKQNKEFIYQFLLSIEDKWISQGSTFGAVNRDDIESKKIKLPPLKEQEKIAEILSSCDEHIKNLKNLKSELEKEKLHLMNELLSGKTRFSSFTTPWQEVTLADICDIQKGQQLNKLNLQENGKFPVINGGIEPSGYYDEFNTQENTITISEGGNSCGYVNFLTTKFWSGGHCYTLQNVKIDNKFLYFYLKYQEKDIMKLRLGSGLPNIQKGSISAVIIKYPSLEEQKKIGEVLSACDERLECLNELITAETTLKSHLLTELLSGNLIVKI